MGERIFLLLILTLLMCSGVEGGGGAVGGGKMSWAPPRGQRCTIQSSYTPCLLLPRPSLYSPTSSFYPLLKFFPPPYLATDILPILEGPVQTLPSPVIFLSCTSSLKSNMTLWLSQLGFKSHFYQYLIMWHWAGYLISLSLSFSSIKWE